MADTETTLYDKRYDKWRAGLEGDRGQFHVRGCATPLKDIVSGHLVPTKTMKQKPVFYRPRFV